jgi:hypothetical protein
VLEVWVWGIQGLGLEEGFLMVGEILGWFTRQVIGRGP